MAPKILIAFGVLVYAVLIPVLEINSSHVFNPLWIAHARFHEVWQLITNISIGILALWFAFAKNDIRTASTLNILVMGGALVAHIMEGYYGGSILSGNITKTIIGMEVAAFAASLVVILAFAALLLGGKKTSSQQL